MFARTKGRCHPPRMGEVDGNAPAMLLRRKPVLGDQEMMLTIRCHEKEARVGALVLTSPEPAWTEVCCFIPQGLLRRRGEIRERTRNVRRAVGGLRRCCECR